jgi:hypothetical protein
MNKNQCKLFLGVLLLLLIGVTSTHAQPPRGSSQPSSGEERRRPQAGGAEVYDQSVVERSLPNSVLVRIRYKTEYGYKSETTYGKPGPTSCSAFSVALAKPANPMRPGYLIPVNREDKMTEEYGYYFCRFLVTELALDQEVTIGASVDDQGPWLGGTQSQPPSGYRRALTDVTRTVRLTQSEPRAEMNFEMFYEPTGEFIKSNKLPSDLIRKP